MRQDLDDGGIIDSMVACNLERVECSVFPLQFRGPEIYRPRRHADLEGREAGVAET